MDSRPAALLGEVGSNRLRFTNVRGLKSLGSTDDIELEPLAFGQRLEALALDRGVVNEHVLATLLLDETKTLRFVEPLHRSVCHLQTPSTNRGIAPTQRPFRAYGPATLVGPPDDESPRHKEAAGNFPCGANSNLMDYTTTARQLLSNSIGQITKDRNINLGFGVTLYTV